MIKYLLCLFTIILLLTGSDCKKNPVAPPPSNGSDTTSNNFTFQSFSFGGNAGSCYFQDVTIINDTDIWAVGAVYLDSANGNPDPFPYNAAHWNGQTWTLEKITVTYKGNPVIAPLNGIFAFSGTDIWMTNGFPVHGDGVNWQMYQLQDMGIGASVSKVWGTSSSNIYFVGDEGSIVNYNGSSWTKITSGTSLTFNDIYGSGGEILAVCIQFSPPGGTIYNIGLGTKILSNPIQQHPLYSVWFVPDRQYYVVGDGIYQKNSLSDSTWRNGTLDITKYGTTKVRGNGTNDVFVVGAYGEFLHWNGASWKSFIAQTGLANGCYGSVAVSGNLVVAVGQNGTQAVITVGRRQ